MLHRANMPLQLSSQEHGLAVVSFVLEEDLKQDPDLSSLADHYDLVTCATTCL